MRGLSRAVARNRCNRPCGSDVVGVVVYGSILDRSLLIACRSSDVRLSSQDGAARKESMMQILSRMGGLIIDLCTVSAAR